MPFWGWVGRDTPAKKEETWSPGGRLPAFFTTPAAPKPRCPGTLTLESGSDGAALFPAYHLQAGGQLFRWWGLLTGGQQLKTLSEKEERRASGPSGASDL